MSGKKNNKGQVAVIAKQLVAGTEKRLMNKTQVEFMGSSFTPAEITSKLQALVDLRANVDAAKAATRARIAEEAAGSPALRAFQSAFVSFVKVAFGHSPEALADFGITTPKAREPLTVEEMAATVAKRASTREARHTLGSRQKKGIKGAVTGVLVTPITATTPAPSSPTVPATSGAPTAATPRVTST